jgi:hypothetical protein
LCDLFVVGCEIGLDLKRVVVRISQRVMHVGWPQVGIGRDDFLDRHPLPVECEDEADTNSRPHDYRASATAVIDLLDPAIIYLRHGPPPPIRDRYEPGSSYSESGRPFKPRLDLANTPSSAEGPLEVSQDLGNGLEAGQE